MSSVKRNKKAVGIEFVEFDVPAGVNQTQRLRNVTVWIPVATFDKFKHGRSDDETAELYWYELKQWISAYTVRGKTYKVGKRGF